MNRIGGVAALLLLWATWMNGQETLRADTCDRRPWSMTEAASSADTVSDRQLTERMQLLQHMVARNEAEARNWWWAWVGIYGGATLVQGIVAAADEDQSTRQDMVLGAGTTLFGVVGQLITPVCSGFEEMGGGAQWISTPQEKMERIRELETFLRRQSEIAGIGKSWKMQALAGSVNLASGLITWLGFKRSVWEGVANFALNTAVTEVQIWTQPVRARKDYQRYAAQYGLTGDVVSPRPSVEWFVQVKPAGIAAGITF